MHARTIFSELKFTHIYFGGLGESTDRMDIVIEDDDTHHDTQTEWHGALTAETATVLTAKSQRAHEHWDFKSSTLCILVYFR